MTGFSSICLYGGASDAVPGTHLDAARRLGRLCAERGLSVIFGGGRVGMMGAVADGALEVGGEVIGIIPKHLEDVEVGHQGVTRLEVVDSMHVRKMRMFDLSDAFCSLPGGLGTLDETFEIMTWRQLGLHDKPVFALDLEGYWAPLKSLLDHQANTGYVRPQHRDILQFVPDADALMQALDDAKPGALKGDKERF
jgi:uncharacterized protein (TIGR00730 family)